MTSIQDILNTFSNSDLAEVSISYCSIDKEYTANLILEGHQSFYETDSDMLLAIEKLAEVVKIEFGSNK